MGTDAIPNKTVWDNPKDSRFLNKMTRIIIQNLFAKGYLREQDLLLSNEAFAKKILLITENMDLEVTIDYRESLIKHAENCYQLKEYQLAVVIYTMFFEHSLNNLIHHQGLKRGMDEKDRNDMIRAINIHGKLTWMLPLLDLQKIKSEHRQTIEKLVNDRNSHVHYKWKTVEVKVDPLEGEKMLREFKKIRMAVSYFKRYESNVLFNKNKRKLINKLAEKGY
ncbi:hypothetical protein [Chitinophaga defluvii]|uniref:Cthe-2314-like HEPN domain-containing protein n=1 Tax=Chitinophaga defluvii TaxID=3163343 RepID=A0ABV2TAY2_9BACT